MTAHLFHTAALFGSSDDSHTQLLAQISITPVQPPGTEGLNTIINFLAWGAFAVCLVGFIGAGAGMAVKHHRGEEMASMKGLGLSLVGTVLIGAATAIVGAVY